MPPGILSRLTHLGRDRNSKKSDESKKKHDGDWNDVGPATSSRLMPTPSTVNAEFPPPEQATSSNEEPASSAHQPATSAACSPPHRTVSATQLVVPGRSPTNDGKSDIYPKSLDGKDASLGKSSIRLLHILPAKKQSNLTSAPLLECELHVTDFDPATAYKDGPKYEALSYTWGIKPRDRLIIVNQHRFMVSEDLETIMQHLQLEREVRVMWIDAVCINQSNNKEKSHQVGMMTRIYKEADRVVVWLGEDDGQAKSAFSRLEELSWAARRIMMQNEITQVEEFIGLNKTGEMKQSFQSALASVGFEEEPWLTSINTLLASSWWTRAWIRQELIVAQFPELFCGRHSLAWISFEQAMSLLVSWAWANTNDSDRSEPLRTFENLMIKHHFSLILQRERYQVWSSKRQTLLDLVRANHSMLD